MLYFILEHKTSICYTNDKVGRFYSFLFHVHMFMRDFIFVQINDDGDDNRGGFRHVQHLRPNRAPKKGDPTGHRMSDI